MIDVARGVRLAGSVRVEARVVGRNQRVRRVLARRRQRGPPAPQEGLEGAGGAADEAEVVVEEDEVVVAEAQPPLPRPRREQQQVPPLAQERAGEWSTAGPWPLLLRGRACARKSSCERAVSSRL